MFVATDTSRIAHVEEAGVPLLSFQDVEAEQREAIENAAVSETLMAPEAHNRDISLLTALFVETLGRRKVYALPRRSDKKHKIQAGLHEFSTNRPFAADVHFEDIETLYAKGDQVQVVEDIDKLEADAILLAFVGSDGSVDLAPGEKKPGEGDRVIALTGGGMPPDQAEIIS
jgi:hypothetical protein